MSLTCAIYARKSTEQTRVADEAKSVTRQIEHARLYAARKDWTVAADHIYSDDGISGAVFGDRRPALAKLLSVLQGARPPFDAIIVMEQSRFGRDTIRTLGLIQAITDAGVALYSYLDDREIRVDDEMGEVEQFMRSWAASSERKKASQRSYDALIRKARSGHVTGGRTYGYRNVRVPDPAGDPTRGHTLLAKDPEQAAIVLRIFRLYAEGRGSTAIARLFNREGIPGPRRGRPWQQSAVRGILRRTTYVGERTWGKLRAVVRRGREAVVDRPEAEWVRRRDEGLRIVDDALWQQVQARRGKNAQTFPRAAKGLLLGRPSWADGHSEHLLSGGLAKCALCGASIRMWTVKHGARKRRVWVRSYVCARNADGGDGACPNAVKVRKEVFDQAGLATITALLTGDLITAAVERAITRLVAERAPALERRAAVDRELAALDQRIARAVDALLDGEALPEIRGRLGEYRARRTALAAERQSLDHLADVASLDGARIAQEARRAAADVVALLGGHTAQARQMLRKLLDEPLAVTPFEEGGRRGFRFTGQLVLDRLVSGEVATSLSALSPTRTSAARFACWPAHPAPGPW